MTKLGVHIFRKDLRVEDNSALNQLSRNVDKVVGVFIFDPKQIKRSALNSNHYSIRAAQFIIDSVKDLNKQCNGKLIVGYGHPSTVLESILHTVKPSHVSFNSDFTQYSIARDRSIVKICERLNIESIMNDSDQSLIEMRSMLKRDGSPYMVYGGFFKNLSQNTIAKPKSDNIIWTKPKIELNNEPLQWNLIEATWEGGRSGALKRLKRSASTMSDLLINESSQISAYLNYGCVSIREVYHSFKRSYGTASDILRSLAWRDFFLCIFRFSPDGNSYTTHIDHRYDIIKWTRLKQSEWERFMSCKTGFLMVDACMTELLKTGYINNRARLILSTFWIKYLLISPLDLEYGSQVWFSRLLIDCSASQNKLNHQWVIGDLDLSGRRFGMRGTHPLTGRMIRVDNEMIKRYDPNYEYIKKWLPEFAIKSLKECKVLAKQTKPMYEWRERYAQYSMLFDNLT